MPSSPRPASRTSWTAKGELKLYSATCFICNWSLCLSNSFLTAAAFSLTELQADLTVFTPPPGTFCFTTNSSWNMNSSLHRPARGDELRCKDYSSCMGSDERGTNTNLPESPRLVAALTLTQNPSLPHTNTSSTVRHARENCPLCRSGAKKKCKNQTKCKKFGWEICTSPWRNTANVFHLNSGNEEESQLWLSSVRKKWLQNNFSLLQGVSLNP